VDTREAALQVARIPVLLLLSLWAASEVTEDLPFVSGAKDAWVSWVSLSLISLTFVLVVLVGRRRWHPWAVLGAEALVAAVLAFLPPFQWILWFGPPPAWAATLLSGFVQPLAMAWFGVVVVRAFHQARGGKPASSERDSLPAGTSPD
jgi:hypothetical protein